MKARYVVLMIVIVVLLIVVGILIYERDPVPFQSDENVMTYKQISMNEAKEIFESDTDGSYIILDVRRAEEYAEGHIPGSINVANESIKSEAPAKLPDKNQMIYVYCRSGNRSKQAAEKLAALGYTNIVEFGGILDWTGEIVRNGKQ